LQHTFQRHGNTGCWLPVGTPGLGLIGTYFWCQPGNQLSGQNYLIFIITSNAFTSLIKHKYNSWHIWKEKLLALLNIYMYDYAMHFTHSHT
jgi:hypothetical protein